MSPEQPGTEIAGYRIESLIGRGGMAVVYRAEDLRLGRKVALKLLTPQLVDSEQFRQRFVRESRLAASLDHPNIVPIYEAGEADGQLFIAMRYVLGSDLKGLLTEEGGQLSVERALRLFGQIGDALDSAHRAGLVHRDVKPGNVLVSAGREHTRSGSGDHVYLTDFGLTKRSSELTGGLTGTGHFLGTVDYVSPEQIQGRPVGPGTDIYALGCVLYECLTGQLPFRRDDDAALLWAHLVEPPPPVTGIRPELPGAVNAVVARAMAKDPAHRYASCEELMSDLELALGVTSPVPFPGGRDQHTGGPRPADTTSHRSRTELGTVTGDVPGGSAHPSFPSGPFPRLPADSRATSASPRSPDAAEPEYAEPEFAEPGYADPDDAEPGDAEPGDAEFEDAEFEDAEDDSGGWDQDGPEAPPARPAGRRRWVLVALAAAAVVLVVVAGVLVRSFLSTAGYRSFTSNDTVIPFRLEHPDDWGSVVSPASDIVLGPDATSADELFFLRGTPEAWARTTDVVRRGAPEDVWLYVYTQSATFDTSSVQFLWESIAQLLPADAKFEGHRAIQAAGARADEMEAVTSDPADPQTRLRVVVDVVQPPGAGGAVLLAFFAPPQTFEEHRSTFEQVRDSLEIPH